MAVYSVMVRKTVQVNPYEPTVVEIRIEGECEREEAVEEVRRTFAEIKAEMNDIFNGKKKVEDLLG